MLWGIGSFSAAAMRTLRENGAEVSCYLTRKYGRYGPSLEGPIYSFEQYPNPCSLIRKKEIDLVIPMSIDWHQQDWTEEFIGLDVPIFSPKREAMLLERDRDFGRKLCREFGINYPRARVARNRLEAEQFIKKNPGSYVIKNPLCSPSSPIHTIVCETEKDTQSWLQNIDYAEGVFLQEYMGRREAGHIAFVSGGELYPVVTNQEYKRAFDGNMGPVAGAPLGGLIEADLGDKYGLAEKLLAPLLPWFRKTGFCGPVQVTAVFRDNKWYVIEFNVRTGVTTGPALWRMLENPLDTLIAVSGNKKVDLRIDEKRRYACLLTLAGWGYPYTRTTGPQLPVNLLADPTCDIWWNEVSADASGQLFLDGHRIADVVAHGRSLVEAIETAYENIKKISCLSSYYRLDIGKSLWPPGEE
jgi:phosphoribosylamine--glycine ligase